VEHRYIRPNYTLNHTGSARKIGFELEFSGLQIEQTAAIVASVFEGSLKKKSSVEIEVNCRETGKFIIELDWHYGKKIAESRTDRSLPRNQGSADVLMDWLKWVVGRVVPVEVVCPPMVYDNLDRLDVMVEQLRSAGAKGTEDSFVYAFGVHINPEIPSSDPGTIANYLQAFCLAQKWLFEKNHVDPTRKVIPYIKGYPEKYIETVLHYHKDITHQEMIDDYMLYNPTRNRALDMLPLWNFLQPRYCQHFKLNDTLTRKRPTFHYRLPNCEIDKNGWFLHEGWNLWCVIERIASSKKTLNALLESRRESIEQSLFIPDTKWHSELEKIYHDL
jgi:hypothetical protein